MAELGWTWLGRRTYAQGLEAQQRVAAARESGGGGDVMLLLEHERVYTAGRRTSESEILWDESQRAARGIEFFRTDRGGKVTYHGPGQLVGYPIVDIRARGIGVRGWVEMIERAIIDTLAPLGIEGKIECAAPGVWLGTAKIAAIGIHVSRGVSRHGFALNVSPDLADYGGIIPCGLQGRTVTSIAELRGGDAPPIAELAAGVAAALAARMGSEAREIPVPNL